jgi:hypothetical protein
MRKVPSCRKTRLLVLFLLFASAAATHHSPMMLLPGGRGTTTNLAWRLLRQRLWCRRGCSSSPHQKGIANHMVHYPTYSYVGHNPQPTHNNWSIGLTCVVAMMIPRPNTRYYLVATELQLANKYTVYTRTSFLFRQINYVVMAGVWTTN